HLGMLDGYEPTHPITLVYETEMSPRHDLDACEKVFELLNIGDDPDFGTPDPTAVEYRARGNRSLSVGDVVSVDGRFYACGRVGSTALRRSPTVIVRAEPGTTPLPEEARSS